MKDFAERLTSGFATALHYWPFLLGGSSVISITIVMLIGWWALCQVINRLVVIPDVHKLDSPADSGPVAPVPVRLTDVRFRYPTSDHDALGPVSLTVEPGEHVAVTGPNGSGKTTLMLMLAGRQPSSGAVDRPGAVGLGRIGGTAVILQHPESQVLGTRVADDVVWGLPPGADHRRRINCSARSASTAWPNATPAACPAVSCNASRWPRRWPGSRRC